MQKKNLFSDKISKASLILVYTADCVEISRNVVDVHAVERSQKKKLRFVYKLL